MSRGEVALARAQAAAETALADLLASPSDSGFITRPRGTTTDSVFVRASDTVRVTVQALGGGMVRVALAARAWSRGLRADAGTLAFLRAIPDSGTGPRIFHLHRLPGFWWAPLP